MTAGQVWFILDVVKLLCYAGFGLLLARMATGLLAFLLRRYETQRRRYPLLPLTWLALIAVAMGLISCLVGGDYYVPDPTLGQANLDYQARGWPLSIVSFGDSPFRWDGATATATALLCIAIDLAAVVAILTATRYVLDRWLAPSPEASLARRARDVLLWAVAVGAALAVEPWLSSPLMVPGTEVAFYSSLVHEMWHVRLAVLFGVGCTLFAVGHLARLGLQAFGRMRSEGIL